MKDEHRMVEDDEHWHPKNFVMSVHWLDDLETVVRMAKAALQRQGKAEP